MEKIKRCPFCGAKHDKKYGEPVVTKERSGAFKVEHDYCGATGPITYSGEDEAIKAWNRGAVVDTPEYSMENSVVIKGRILKTTGVTELPNGDKVCNVKLLNVTTDKGKRREMTIQCTAWGDRADTLASFGCGEVITVVGSLRPNHWQKDGINHRDKEVKVKGIMS